MTRSILRVVASALRHAWQWTIAFVFGLSSRRALPAKRSPELEELFRAATALRAEDGLIPMSALRRLSTEDRAAVQRISQSDARRMIRAWADASGVVEDRQDRGATEATEPYRKPR